MKKYLFLALGVAALTSCSSDEVTELNQGNEIKFSVVADNDSRAATVYCNNNLMDEFYVYATADGTPFINADLIKYENSKWENKTATQRYWPETFTAMNFYGVVSETGETLNKIAVSDAGVPQITNFEPATDVAEQTDLLYAVENVTTKPDNGQVSLNFRHALSQIEFRAVNKNQYIDVQIEKVVVGNVLSKGTSFALPTSTKDNTVQHANGSGTFTANSQGTWTLANTTANYVVESYSVPTDGAPNYIGAEGDETSLTLATANHGVKPITGNYSKTMLLLPQTSTQNGGKWNATSVVTPETAVGTAGTYLGVKCKIYNVTKVGETTHRTLIYGTDADYKWALVPVDLTWDQGKKYVYTFVFNTGNGGFTPDGDDVLNGISLDVTVDDFILGEGSPFDTPMQTE